MGVAGDLQVHRSRDRRRDLFGLMGQQHHRRRGIGIRQCRIKIRTVPFDARPARRGVVNARDNELVPLAVNDDVPIVQCVPTDTGDVVEPALRLAEVFVVAGDVDAGQLGPHIGERPGLPFAYRRGAVGDITDVAHDVGIERVDALHHRCAPAGTVDRPEMRVGDDRDAQAVEPFAESGDGHVDASDTRHSHRFGIAPHQQDDDDRDHHVRDDTRPLRILDAGHEQRQLQQLAQHRPDEQHPRGAEQCVSRSGRPIEVPTAVSEHHHRGQTRKGRREYHGAGDDHDRGPVRTGEEQRPPRQPEEEQHDGDDDGQPTPPTPWSDGALHLNRWSF